jgi:rhodanese-related sulfurtransferase
MNANSPHTGGFLTPTQLSQRLAAEPDLLLLDVRGYSEFAQERIAGSTCVPWDELSHRHDEIPRERSVVLLCATGRRSGLAAAALASRGIMAAQLEGGIAAWRGSGLATWSRPAWALERQVRLGAGGLVLLGLAGGLAWPPLLYLSWLVGAGLIFAAVSDTCLMGALLMRMPWNRPARAASD